MNENCVLCLEYTQTSLITEMDVKNVSFLHKLTSLVPETRWPDDLKLCRTCTENLDSAYDFREKCLKAAERFANITSTNGTTEDVLKNVNQTEPPNKHQKCHKPRRPIRKTETHDKLQSNRKSSPNNKEPTNMCTYCGKVFTAGSANKLTDHERTHLNLRSYVCPVCQKGFNTASGLRTHRLLKHGDPATQWRHHCTACGKRFLMKSSYDSHVRRHLGDKPFTCHICTKAFVTKSEVRVHVVTHSNVREHRCGECGQEFKDKGVLTLHLAKKHGIGSRKVPEAPVKRLSCPHCEKKFAANSKLARHVRTHTGEKPFVCGECGRRFIDGWYLKQHAMKAHGLSMDE